jgi:hypothetical protein
MGPKLVDYLLYEPEDTGILWIKFNRPERMNALIGSSEESGTVAKVGEYMRDGDDDPNVRVIVLTGVGRGLRDRPEIRSGRVNTAVTSCPSFTSARNALAAGFGVPKKMMRVISLDPTRPIFDRGH